MLVEGFEIPHAHIHLIPANSPSDINLEKKLDLQASDLQNISEKIKEHIKQ